MWVMQWLEKIDWDCHSFQAKWQVPWDLQTWKELQGVSKQENSEEGSFNKDLF
jgi:hypothetical protein